MKRGIFLARNNFVVFSSAAKLFAHQVWLWHCAAINSLLERITIQPDICHGKPVIRSLRYPVESVLEYLAALSLKVKSQHLVLA